MKTFLLSFLIIGTMAGWADDAILPGIGFTASRYESLWTKSPFAVETPEVVEQPAAVDYSMVGAAKFDGISYVNLIDKQNQEHFLLSSNKPVRGLTLVSVTRDPAKSGVTAVIQRNGQMLSLSMEPGPGGPLPAPIPNNAHVPLPMPGAPPGAGGNDSNRMQIPPPAAIKRPPIRVPRPSPSSSQPPATPPSHSPTP